MTNYLQLKKIFEKYYNLEKINAVLNWDRQVMMPNKGFEMRKQQQILLDNLCNEVVCSSEVKELVNNCDTFELSDLEKRDFSLMKNIVLHKAAIPKKLQQEFVKIGLETEFIWAEAKKKDNFKLFNKPFKKLVNLVREIALLLSFGSSSITPYLSGSATLYARI